jgi:hypothetical protein
MYNAFDTMLWIPNMKFGLIAHKEADAAELINKIRYAYKYLPEPLKKEVKIVTDNKNELVFSNDSSIAATTVGISRTYQELIITEMGKICAKFPEKAYGIVQGALNTVAVGQHIVVESTAEGNTGWFAEQIIKAKERQEKGTRLTKMDFKLLFYPWMDDPDCNLDPTDVIFIPRLVEYFKEIEAQTKRVLTLSQKAFYVKKEEQIGLNIKNQFPSTIDEALSVNKEGTYYAEQMTQARLDHRICSVPYQEGTLVDIAWDIGLDGTALWFCQTIGRENHLIDYFFIKDANYGLIYDEVMKKGYRLGTHILPFDSEGRVQNTGLTKLETITNLFQTRNFFPCPPPNKISRADGIQAVRRFLSTCWFDEAKCDEGIEALDNYSKIWNASLARYIDEPKHDESSHASDSMRYLAIYKMLLMRTGGRTDKKSIDGEIKKQKASGSWSKGFL